MPNYRPPASPVIVVSSAPGVAYLAAPDDGGGAPPTPPVGAADESRVGKVAALASVVLFIVALVVAVILFDPKSGPTYVPVEGIGAFALFYIVAQAAERLVEMVAPLLDGKVTKKTANKTALALAVQAANAAGTQAAANAAADAQAKVDTSRKDTAAIAFALTATIGMLACAYLDADFLSAVGVDFHGSTKSEWLRLALTGLVVGGGSTKLHDLIGNLSKSSAKKDDPKETSGS